MPDTPPTMPVFIKFFQRNGPLRVVTMPMTTGPLHVVSLSAARSSREGKKGEKDGGTMTTTTHDNINVFCGRLHRRAPFLGEYRSDDHDDIGWPLFLCPLICPDDDDDNEIFIDSRGKGDDDYG